MVFLGVGRSLSQNPHYPIRRLKTVRIIAGGLGAIFASKIALSAGILPVVKALAVLPLEVLQLGGPPSPSFAQIAASNGENYDPGTLLRSL